MSDHRRRLERAGQRVAPAGRGAIDVVYAAGLTPTELDDRLEASRAAGKRPVVFYQQPPLPGAVPPEIVQLVDASTPPRRAPVFAQDLNVVPIDPSTTDRRTL